MKADGKSDELDQAMMEVMDFANICEFRRRWPTEAGHIDGLSEAVDRFGTEAARRFLKAILEANEL